MALGLNGETVRKPLLSSNTKAVELQIDTMGLPTIK